MPATYTEIKFYNISAEKKTVSKSLGTAVLTLDGVPLAGTNIQTPSFRVSLADKAKLTGINYAYIADYNRYYYITDKVFLGNSVWKISLKVDVLKSFSSSISSAYAHVLRTSNSNYYDNTISDNYFPTKHAIVSENINVPKAYGRDWDSSNEAFANYSETGYHYLLKIACKHYKRDNDPNSIYIPATGVCYFATTLQGVLTFINSFYGTFPNMTNYVISITWLPFAIPVVTHSATTITFDENGVDTSITVAANTIYEIDGSSNGQFRTIFSANLPDISSGFEGTNPYARMSVSFLPFGQFSIDIDHLRAQGATKINFLVVFNAYSGASALYYYGSDTAPSDYPSNTQIRLLGTSAIEVSVPISGSTGLATAIQSIVVPQYHQMFGGLGGGLGGAIAGLATGMATFALNSQTYNDHNIIQGGGGLVICDAAPMVYYTRYPIAYDTGAIDKFGLPCCKTMSLSSFTSGDFVVCDEADFAISGMEDAEINEIENWLKEGVYI